MLVFTLLLVSVAVSVAAVQAAQKKLKDSFVPISVLYNSTTKTFDVNNVFDDSYDAYGKYYKNYQGNYWNYLDGFMQSEISSVQDHLKYSRALGFLEGFVTCEDIKIFYGNFYSATFGADKVGAQTLHFLNENFRWLKKMSKENADDDYWYSVGATLQQLEGLHEGYNKGCGAKTPESLQQLEDMRREKYDYSDVSGGMRFDQALMINAWGDLYQITTKFMEPGKNSRLHGYRGSLDLPIFDSHNNKVGSTVSANNRVKLIERCSAIFKVLPDYSDVVFGHATWDSFESLGPRIFKHYSIPQMRNGKAEHHYDVYFSSSPAALSSIDDFFVTSGYAQLSVIETTNSLYNITLVDLVKPQTVLSWTRAVTSNQLARSGAEWPQLFARYASGTYTNQWMSLDLKLFTPGQKPPAGFFNVFEEVPGLVHYADMTDILVDQLYWPSYNNPYFDDIYQQSGYAAACKLNAENCYDTAPRAYLFQQYQSQVTDIDGGQWLMSYNSFQNDTASKQDSCNTIACRGDLEPEERSRAGFGALDAKVSSVLNARREPGVPPVIRARLGPTHDQQPVFCWSQLADESEYVHRGQPDCFDFDWVTFPPTD